MTKNKKKTKQIDFEAALQQIEDLIGNMEQGNISLEESLQLFERGMKLVRSCETVLGEAEQRVQILLEKDKKQTLKDFEPDDEHREPDPEDDLR